MSSWTDWPPTVNLPVDKAWDLNRWSKPVQYGIPTLSFNKATPPSGWICPSCHRVYSPSQSMCLFCPQDMPSDNTDNENDLE